MPEMPIVPVLAKLWPSFLRGHIYMARKDPARAAMVMHWIKHLVLNAFGASRYVPVKLAIVLADPHSQRQQERLRQRGVAAKLDRIRRSRAEIPVADWIEHGCRGRGLGAGDGWGRWARAGCWRQV
jgi:hypothetical protein